MEGVRGGSSETVSTSTSAYTHTHAHTLTHSRTHSLALTQPRLRRQGTAPAETEPVQRPWTECGRAPLRPLSAQPAPAFPSPALGSPRVLWPGALCYCTPYPSSSCPGQAMQHAGRVRYARHAGPETNRGFALVLQICMLPAHPDTNKSKTVPCDPVIRPLRSNRPVLVASSHIATRWLCGRVCKGCFTRICAAASRT